MVRRNVIHHYIQVGDAQRDGEDVARCSCGWKASVPDSEDMTSLEKHYELMTLAEGHKFANSWLILNDSSVTINTDTEFVSDGL